MYQALLTKNKGKKIYQPRTWKISKGDTDVQKNHVSTHDLNQNCFK